MKKERIGLILVNLLLLVSLSCFLSGCMTYKKALRKFGHLAKDSATVIVRDTLVVPKDSVVLSLKTDTTTVHRVIEQGRARIIYDRTHTITTVQAECKPETVIRTILAKCPPVADFGIAPWYRWAFWATLGLLVLSVIVYAFTYLVKLSLIKR